MALGLGVLFVAVWAAFGVNALLTWTPPRPDPKSITRENFRFEMFARERLLGFETQYDVAGAQEKLNEFFPPGTPLDGFIEFANSMKVPSSEHEYMGKRMFGCGMSIDESHYTCRFHYRGIGLLKGEDTWIVFANIDSKRAIKNVRLEIHFMW